MGSGGKVSVGSSVFVAMGARVYVGKGVAFSKGGWKGVGVGDASGAWVTRIKVGKATAAGAGAQAVRSRVQMKRPRRVRRSISKRFGNTCGQCLNNLSVYACSICGRNRWH